jgi:hypothetical protein
MTKIYSYLLLLSFWILGTQLSTAQTTVTPAAAVSNMCVGGGFTTLGTITLAESGNGTWTNGTGKTYIISVPANFEFNTAVTPTVTSTAGITNISASVPTIGTFTFTCDINGGSTDQIYIANIQVRAITAPSAGNILRSGGTAAMSGNATTDNLNHCTLTSIANIAISAHPGNQSVCSGAAASFTVTATGAGLTYAWEESTTGAGGPWVAPSGATGVTSATLSFASTTVSQNGNLYRCVVNGTCGGPLTSNNASLTVTSSLSISGQPANQNVCSGAPASFTVTASGAGITYTWQESTNGGGTWGAPTGSLTGAATATLSFASAVGSQDGYLYRCVIGGTCGGPLTSISASLAVGLSISGQPGNQTVCSGAVASFTITASGAVTSYAWEESTDGGGTWGAPTGSPTGAATATLSFASTTVSQNGYQYHCLISGPCGGPLTSNPATLAVNQSLAISGQPADQSVCIAASPSFTVAAAGAGISYSWEKSTDGGSTWVVPGAGYTGALTATLTNTAAILVQNGTLYHCVISGTCAPITSNFATLTVTSGLAISAQPGNQTVCQGASASFSVTATGGGITYAWEESTDGGGSWGAPTGSPTGANTATLSFASTTLSQTGYLYRCVINGTCGGPITSGSATLTITPTMSITTDPAATDVCSGSPASFTVVASGATSYSWQVSSNGGGSWAATTIGAGYTGNSTATLTNTSAAGSENNYLYKCIVTGTCGGPLTSNTALQSVFTGSPSIGANPSNQSKCSGGTATFNVTASNLVSYQWQEGISGTYSNITDGGVYSGATTNTLTLTAVTLGMDARTYKCKVTNPCGTTTSTAATLTISSGATFFGLDAQYCVNAAKDTLEGFPVGGVFSGSGMGATNGAGKAVFNPSAATVGGPYTINYTYGGCVIPRTTTVRDTSGITITSPSLSTYNTTDAAVNIVTETGGVPVTSICTGVGVSGTKFYPSVAGQGGPYVISASYTNTYGCLTSATKSVSVVDPSTAIPSLSGIGICSNGAIIALDQNSIPSHPTFGTAWTDGSYVFSGYTGNGINYISGNNYQFNPASVTPGTPFQVNYLVTYYYYDWYYDPYFGTWYQNSYLTAYSFVYASQNVIVQQAPTVTFNLPSTICKSAGNLDMSTLVSPSLASGAVGSGFYLVSGTSSNPLSGLGNKTFNPSVITNAQDTYDIKYVFISAGGGGCKDSMTKTITVYDKPTLPVVSTIYSPQNSVYCMGDYTNYMVVDYYPTYDYLNYNYNWYTDAALTAQISTSFFIYPPVPTNAPTVAAGIDYYVTRSIPGAGCASNPLIFNFKVNDRAVVDANVDQTVCGSNPATLAASSKYVTSSTNLAGTWSGGSAANFSNINSPTSTYTPDATDISNGYVNLTFTSVDPDGSGPCPAAWDDMRITINPVPLVNAGPDQTICSSSSVQLSASLSGSASGITWSGGTDAFTNKFLSQTQYIANATEKSNNTVIFTATTNDPDGAGPCVSASDLVSVTFSDQASVNAGSPQTICSGTTASLAGTSIRLNSAALLSASWYSPTSGGFSPNANTLSAVYSPTFADSANGYVDLVLRSIDPDGVLPCPIDTQVVRININKAAKVYAGPDATYCSNNVITLSGTPLGSANSLTWSGGGGTIANPGLTITNYTATTTEKSNNTVVFTATTNDPDGSGPCPAVQDQMSITLSDQAAVNAGTPQTICSGTTATLAGASIRLNTGAPLSATWYSPTSGGFTPNANTLSAVYTPTFADSANGYVDLVLRSIDPDGVLPCPIDTQVVRININKAAKIYAGQDVTYCSNNVITLSGTPLGSATSLTWSGGGGSISNPTFPQTLYSATTVEKSGNTVIFTALSNDPDGSGPCPAVSDNVSITINEQANVNAGLDLQLCRSKASTIFNLNGLSELAFSHAALGATWSGGAGVFGANASLTSTYTAGASEIPADGTFKKQVTLYLTTSDPDGIGGPCLAVQDSMVLTVNPLPDVQSVIVPSNSFCKTPTASSFLLNATVVTNYGGSGIYSDTTTAANGVVGNSFYPAVAGVGQHKIYHIYTDGNSCKNDHDTLINVYGIPRPKFTIAEYCATKPTYFDANSSDVIDFSTSGIDPGSTITSYSWVFGNNYSITDTSTASATNYIYDKTLDPSAKQTFTVSLKLGTDHGCFAQKDSLITIGNIPSSNFSWSKICPADPATLFKDISSFPISEVNKYTWDFNDGFTQAGLGASNENPAHKMAGGTGAYDVKFKILSNIGCSDSITHKVNILDEYKPTPSDPYTLNFASTDGFWSVDGQNPSWEWGIANKANISTPGRKVWVTDTLGTYNVSEKSYLNGPCLNMTDLSRPMISLKINSATQNQIAGAVLQSSIDGGTTWNVVGAMGGGVNWYDNFGVLGNPGSQSVNQFAWTGTYPDWKISKYNLNNLAGNTSVRLRIGFGSGQDTLTLKDGFAIDSIWVGNRDKVLLVENFTNSSTVAVIGSDAKMNTLVNSRPNDLVAVHYHTGFPGSDPMNLRNQADPSSRVLHYGVPKIPYVVFDGNYNYGDTLRDVNVDRRSLDPALFKINMNTDINGSSVKVSATITANDTISDNFVVHAVVVERNVTTVTGSNSQTNFEWVATRMLPDAGGTFFNQNMSKNESVDVNLQWDYFSNEVYDPSQLGVVVFVQNVLTKEVYQSSYLLGTASTPTALSNSLSNQTNVDLFPNPSSKETFVMFNQNIDQDLDWTVYDQLGKVMDKGKISKGNQGFVINNNDYPDGVYAVRITDGEKVLFKKLMVAH